MEKQVLSYKEFLNKKTRITENDNDLSYDLDANEESDINEENFLSKFMNFLQGLFNLFNDKKVKSALQVVDANYEEIIDAEDIDYEEIEDHVDGKELKKNSEKIIIPIKDRCEVDLEEHGKAVKSVKQISVLYRSLLSMIFAYQKTMRLPVIQTMMKNETAKKKFVWVPGKFRLKNGVVDKNWYTDKECVLDPKVQDALIKLCSVPDADLPRSMGVFVKSHLELISKANNKTEEFKKESEEWLTDLYNGINLAMQSVVDATQSMITNTDDKKLVTYQVERLRKDKEKKEKSSSRRDKNKKDKETDKESETTQKSNTKKSGRYREMKERE